MTIGERTVELWKNKTYKEHMCRVHRKYSVPKEEDVIHLYSKGYSLKKVSTILNTNIWQVKLLLKDIMRPSGFQNGHTINIGKKCSLRTKKRIRDAQIGKKREPLTQEHKNKISMSNMGKIWTEDAKLKISGKNSYLWKGGLTNKNLLERSRCRYSNWRKSIMEKDNFTCQIIGKIGGKLVVHHIFNFATNKRVRYKMNNGITMRKEVHDLFHSIYGRRGNNLEQLEEFKKNIEVSNNAF